MIDQPITDTAQANAVLSDLYASAVAKQCVVARGRVRIPAIMPGFALVIHRLRPDPVEDIVDMRGKGKIYAASFLRQIADTAGLKVVRSHRTDDGRDPYLREFECVVQGMDLLMKSRQAIGRYELDLRDGSPKIDAILAGPDKSRFDGKPIDKAKKIRDLREHINQRAETGAFCRAVVEALAISRAFKDKKADISRLDVLVPAIEMHVASAPPEVRQAMAIAAVQAQMGAFGVQQPMALPPMQQPAALPEPTDTHYVDSVGGGDWGDEPPFQDQGPVDDDGFSPPTEALNEVDTGPINDAQKEELKRLGAWSKEVLVELGWSGEGRPSVAVYHRAVQRYGGQR